MAWTSSALVTWKCVLILVWLLGLYSERELMPLSFQSKFNALSCLLQHSVMLAVYDHSVQTHSLRDSYTHTFVLQVTVDKECLLSDSNPLASWVCSCKDLDVSGSGNCRESWQKHVVKFQKAGDNWSDVHWELLAQPFHTSSLFSHRLTGYQMLQHHFIMLLNIPHIIVWLHLLSAACSCSSLCCHHISPGSTIWSIRPASSRMDRQMAQPQPNRVTLELLWTCMFPR